MCAATIQHTYKFVMMANIETYKRFQYVNQLPLRHVPTKTMSKLIIIRNEYKYKRLMILFIAILGNNFLSIKKTCLFAYPELFGEYIKFFHPER